MASKYDALTGYSNDPLTWLFFYDFVAFFDDFVAYIVHLNKTCMFALVTKVLVQGHIYSKFQKIIPIINYSLKNNTDKYAE